MCQQFPDLETPTGPKAKRGTWFPGLFNGGRRRKKGGGRGGRKECGREEREGERLCGLTEVANTEQIATMKYYFSAVFTHLPPSSSGPEHVFT